MSSPVLVKGTQKTGGDTGSVSVISKALDGAFLLYTQDNFNTVTNGYRAYMARWLFLEGGRYIIKAWADDSANIIINKERRYRVGYGREYKFEAYLDKGGNLFQISIQNDVPDSPAFVAFALYKDGAASPEYISKPEGWKGDLVEYPDVGDNPYLTNDSYPVWPLEHNWGDTITETIEWLTDVLESESGAEQRRKLRTFPRRVFTASFVEWQLGQRMLDAAAVSLSGGKILAPIYWDKQVLQSDTKEGDVVIPGDFGGRWEYAEGRSVILKNPSNLIDSEVVTIKALTETSMVISSGLKKDWPTGTLMYPAVLSRISSIESMERVVNDAASTKVTFEVLEPFKVEKKFNYMEKNSKTGKMSLYGLTHNWNESVTIDVSRNVVIHDNTVGKSLITDVGKNSYTLQKTSVFLQGVSGHKEFLEFLFALEGQAATFHMITKQEDIKPVKDIIHEEGYIACEPIGYTAFGTVSQDIRTWLVIQKNNGERLYAKAISTRISGDTEYIVLEHAVGTIPLEDILMICWCPISRLASDSVDIEHHTDIEGFSSTTLVFKSFYDRRKSK